MDTSLMRNLLNILDERVGGVVRGTFFSDTKFPFSRLDLERQTTLTFIYGKNTSSMNLKLVEVLTPLRKNENKEKQIFIFSTPSCNFTLKFSEKDPFSGKFTAVLRVIKTGS